MPLYSIGAWGRFYGKYPFGSFYANSPRLYGYCIYQRRRNFYGGFCIKERYYESSNPHHPNCVIGQNSFRSAVQAWQNLTGQGKEIYNSYKYPAQMSGYNRFLHYYLRGLPV